MSTRDIDEPDLGYADIIERTLTHEEKRQRERMLMEEGTAMWRVKKKEEYEQALQDQYDVRYMIINISVALKGHFTLINIRLF